MDELYSICDSCGMKTRHKILRVKDEKSGLVICKCSKCNSLKHEKVDPQKKEIMFLISRDGLSSKKHAYFEPLFEFNVGDVLELDGNRYEVCSIEESNGTHSNSSAANNIRNICIAPYEQKISISIHQAAEQTKSHKLIFAKDIVLNVGDILKIDGIDMTIERISTAEGLPDKSDAGHILAIQGRVLKGV